MSARPDSQQSNRPFRRPTMTDGYAVDADERAACERVIAESRVDLKRSANGRGRLLFVRTCWRFLVGAWNWRRLDPRHRASSPRDLWRVARLYERTRP